MIYKTCKSPETLIKFRKKPCVVIELRMQLRKTTKLDTMASKSLVRFLHAPLQSIVIAQGQEVVTVQMSGDEWSFEPDEKTNGTGKSEIIDCIKTENVTLF